MAIAVIWGLFKLTSDVFNLMALLLMLGGLYEWRRLCSSSFTMLGIAALPLLGLYFAYQAGVLAPSSMIILLAIGVVMWLLKTLQLSQAVAQVTAPKCLFEGTLLLSIAWLAMVSLRDVFGQHTLLLVLLMVWSADSFAYFGGKLFGATKLAPSISPGKTREGVASGVLVAMLVALVYTHFVIAPIASFSASIILLVMTVLVALISVVGDLSESKLKRAAGMKDSGAIIPGHGGILDRIDGLIAGVVIYAFYAHLMHYIV